MQVRTIIVSVVGSLVLGTSIGLAVAEGLSPATITVPPSADAAAQTQAVAPSATATTMPTPTLPPTSVPTTVQSTSVPAATAKPTTPPATSAPTPASSATNATSTTIVPQPQNSGASFIEHTVEGGDTLNGIAKQYGVAADDILSANEIANPNSLSVGDVLRIPVKN